MSGSENQWKMEYCYEMSTKEESDCCSFQGIDIGTTDSFLEFSEDIKDIHLVIKQENNNTISSKGKIADGVNVLKEDKKLNAMKEDKDFEIDAESEDSGSFDCKNEMKEKSSRKSGLSQSCKSYITVNVESNQYSLKNFKNKYTCKLCSETFQYKTQILKHLNAHENGFKCDLCPKVFSSKLAITTHVLTHNKKFSVCCYCNQSFEEDELMEHIPTHFEDDDCDVSEKEFTDESSLENPAIAQSDSSKSDEMELSHDGDSTKNKVITDLSLESISPRIIFKDRYYCNHCESTYRYVQDIKRHMLVKHPNEDTVSDTNFEHECQFCLKKFKFPSQLETHKAIHFNLTKFNCNHCGKSFEKQLFLTKHLRAVHKDKSQSDVCIKSSSNNGVNPKLNADVKPKLNADVKPKSSANMKSKSVIDKSHVYKCNVCRKNFRNPSDLKIHKKKNHNKHEFHCDYCEKSFKYYFDLSRHMRENHANEPDSSFNFDNKCEKCGKTFQFPRGLKLHAYSHLKSFKKLKTSKKSLEVKKNKCKICKKEFVKVSILKSHLKVHSNEKPFKCDVCDKLFKYKSSLTVHKRQSHDMNHVNPSEDSNKKIEEENAIKPYQCNICKSKFSDVTILEKHVKEHRI